MTSPSQSKTRAEEFFLNRLNQLLSPMPKKKTPRSKRKRSPERPQAAVGPTTPSPSKHDYELKSRGTSKSPSRQSESPKLSTARFWSDKAEILESPKRLRESPKKLCKDSKFNSQSTSPVATPSSSQLSSQGLLSTRTTPTKTLPLSDDDIADMLRKLKPNDPRAQAWVQAHEIRKTEHARTLAQVEDRLELRRKIARRLRDKASAVAKESGAPKQDIQAFLEEQDAEDQNTGGIPDEDAIDKIHERVAIAHAKLQETMFDLNEWRKNR